VVQPACLLKFALLHFEISTWMKKIHPKDVIAVLKAGSAVFTWIFRALTKSKV
jgi:hypothetical protein